MQYLPIYIKNGFPEGHNNNILFQLLQQLYAKTATALDGNPDEIFKTYLGVRQGGPESPFLYNLYMDYERAYFYSNVKRNKCNS